jgi:hypothetical protein
MLTGASANQADHDGCTSLMVAAGVVFWIFCYVWSMNSVPTSMTELQQRKMVSQPSYLQPSMDNWTFCDAW